MNKNKDTETKIIIKEIYQEPKILSHKKYVYNIIAILSIIGLIVPFAAQFILPFFYPCCRIAGAEVWNQYVSIILGIVATLMSVISLKMSFDNVEQSHQTELRTRELFYNIEKNLKNIEHNQENYLTKSDVINLGLLRNAYIVEDDPTVNNQWKFPGESQKQESKNI